MEGVWREYGEETGGILGGVEVDRKTNSGSILHV